MTLPFLISGAALLLLFGGVSTLTLRHESEPAAPPAAVTPAAYQLVVKKSTRQLLLYDGKRKLLKTYKIALGPHPFGTKQKQGDGATPEGEYYLTHKNPRSNFYLSLGVSYPNIADAQSGLRRKLISQAQHDAIVAAINAQQKPPQNTKLGGDIFIHGGGNVSDWTAGCIALTNQDIKELFDLLPVKTPVKIEP
ncbi:MAG: L,D-transpeptidase family protein [Blastocatellia bacterium]